MFARNRRYPGSLGPVHTGRLGPWGQFIFSATSSSATTDRLSATQRVALVLWRPLVGFALTTAALKSSPLALYTPPFFWDLLLFGTIALAAVTVIAVRSWPPLSRADKVIVWTMASIAALALTTAPFSDAPERSFAQAAILALMTAFLGLTYLSRWIDRRRLLGDLMLVFAVSAIVQLSGIVSALIGQTWSLGLSGRLLGILGNANYVGMLSAVGVALGLAIFATVAGRRTRALTVAGIVVLSVALLWSGSRGSMVALAVGLIATLVAWRAWWFIVGFIAIVGGGSIAAVVAFPALFDRSGSLDVTSGRGELWGVILEHWASSPIIGTGYRTIEILPGTGGFSSHNIFVWLLTELGIVGLALFATVLVAIAVRGKLSGFVGVAVCVMVAELTESTLYGWGGPAAITFWLVLLAYPAYRRSDLSSATLASAGDLRRVRIRGVST